MNYTEDLKIIHQNSRPKTRWWLQATFTDKEELKREITMLKNAGFSGAEICTTMKGMGKEDWGKQLKFILEIAKEENFEIEFMFLTSGTFPVNLISDVDDPLQGVRLELDGEYITGITKNNPYCGLVPVNEEAVKDAKAVKGSCVLYAVTIAKYIDKENSVLSLESAQELKMGTDVVKTGDDPLSYTVTFTPDDDGEYVLFAWWQHPSGENCAGIPQPDFLGKFGTKLLLQYHNDTFLPHLGEMRKFLKSYFSDSIEWETHLDFIHGFREMFAEKFGFNIIKYLPALYDKEFGGAFRNPIPDFSFDKCNEQLKNCYGELLTDLYIENHLKPIQAFCTKNGFSYRNQTSYGKFLEMERTACCVDIPDTETLYGKDILDFYRAQAGAVHINNRSIYSIEASAEKPGRGNGEENSGRYAQDFKRQLWHLQRAYATGVNLAYFHGCSYRGDYHGQGNDKGVLPGVTWPGYIALGPWGNAWDDRQPNWLGMNQMTDFLSRVQHVLQKGKAIVDLAVYRHCYYEIIDVLGVKKLLDTSLLEQLGYSYDFLSPSHFTDYEVNFDGESFFSSGPQYRALILENQEHLPNAVLEKLLLLSKQGLPIIICGTAPYCESFFGKKINEVNLRALLSSKNTYFCEHIEQIPNMLASLNIRPRVAYREAAKVLNTYRKTEDADYFYFYNYADADTYPEIKNARKISFVADINVKGVPYVLDPWTGAITEAEIVKTDDNITSIRLDIAPNDSLIVMSVPEKNIHSQIETQPHKAILYDDTFNINNWSLTVESWTAGDTPLETKKETVLSTTLYEPIFFTKLESLDAVSGIGYYSAEFIFDKSPEDGYGAFLLADEIEDSYTVEINGITIPANQVYPYIDLGKHLKEGKNTVNISVYSTLWNATVAHHEGNNASTKEKFKDYGMNGPVRIIPYKFK